MDTRETTARAQSQIKKFLFWQVRETLEAEVNFGPNCVFARALSSFLKRLQNTTLF